MQGRPGEGTSVDFNEPFVIRFECDEDGWMLKVNDEIYETYFHLFSKDLIQTVELLGQAEISYVGFGPRDLTPAPPVGFNLTFICPEGQVFEHDWFATPFIMMTCQVNSEHHQSRHNI